MLQILRRNFGLKLFAFALALGGWAYFRFLAGPAVASPFESIGVMHAIPDRSATPCPVK
ncbi:MAG: hypothetical protein JO349_07400 [Candidatus Eremiobacteraeota bacterium]|nr:hypothetical protein [Candidatus Eremiobacteraeota bacterium]